MSTTSSALSQQSDNVRPVQSRIVLFRGCLRKGTAVELRMSRKERDRLKVMSVLAEGRLKQMQAAGLLRLSVRQVRRLLRRYEREGDVGLVHRSRGRPSNRLAPTPRQGPPVGSTLQAVGSIWRETGHFYFALTGAFCHLGHRGPYQVTRPTARMPPAKFPAHSSVRLVPCPHQEPIAKTAVGFVGRGSDCRNGRLREALADPRRRPYHADCGR